MSRYQVIVIGSENSLHNSVLESFYRYIAEIGVLQESIVLIDESTFDSEYRGNAPTVCLYYGANGVEHRSLDILEHLMRDAAIVLPVATALLEFNSQIPKQLHGVNAFVLADRSDVEVLASCIMEGFKLFRISRRLFISYKRSEAAEVAVQLYEQLERNGFDVFLDTHSIRPGEKFQDELWHRMADSEVLVVLNTPGFLDSHWTTEELAKANAMSIGLVQLVWPNHTLEAFADLCTPIQLSASDFGNSRYSEPNRYLAPSVIARIVASVESVRARSLAARRSNMVTEFMSVAKRHDLRVSLQPEMVITVETQDDEAIVVIPTIGVPQALSYQQSADLVQRLLDTRVASAFLLYDHRSIRDEWINHLEWLDNYLPLKSVRIVGVEKWIQTIL